MVLEQIHLDLLELVTLAYEREVLAVTGVKRRSEKKSFLEKAPCRLPRSPGR